MAESCSSPNVDNIVASTSSLNPEADITKTDCTSPSPTETVCLENLCSDLNIPGPSSDRLAPVKDKLTELSRISDEPEDTVREEKDSFLNKLGLDKVEDELEEIEHEEAANFHPHECDEDAWEDCVDEPEAEEPANIFNEIENEEVSLKLLFNNTGRGLLKH